MGDRKTDAAESLEDQVALAMDKMVQDVFKYDKGIDLASSTAIAQSITNAGMMSTIAGYMGLASFGRFLLDLQGIDVQTLIEGVLTKTAASNIAAEEEEKAKSAKTTEEPAGK